MIIKSDQDFESMKGIGAIVANCLQYAISQAKVGMTTKELDDLAHEFLRKYGAVSAPISMYQFPGATCISIEKCAAHGIPNEYRIKQGDLINIDVSASKEGYFADNGQSFVVGQGKPLKHRMCEVIAQVLDESLLEVRAGNKISAYGAKVTDLAKKHQLTVIKNLGGHGVGKSLHEKPEFIPSYPDKKDHRKFTENTVVAIEPFLSNGGHEVDEDKDGWSLIHRKFYSVQKEHTVMITKNKPFIFTQPTMDFL